MKRKTIIVVVIISTVMFSGCYDKGKYYEERVSDFQLEISQLKEDIKEKEMVISDYEKKIEDIGDDVELVDGNHLYKQSMLIENLDRSKKEIAVYKEELTRIGAEYNGVIDKKVLNMVQPETVKIGDVISGLLVTDATSNEYGYEYQIKFEGEFTVSVVLEYNPMYDEFFGTTNDLDTIPYVKNSENGTTFLINDPNDILIEISNGDSITARFNEYAVRRMDGKPLSDVATIIAIINRNE